MLLKNKKAFTLIETIISIVVFVIFVFGIYGGIQFVYKVIYSSRTQVIEMSILNEQMEIIRNLDFLDVGIVSSTPAGVLTRNSTIYRNGVNYQVTRSIRNIDDPADGTIELGTDTSANDYKYVYLEVTCVDCQQRSALSIYTYVSSYFPQDTSNSGAIFVNVKDSHEQNLVGVNVHVVSDDPSIKIDMVDTTDNNGMLKIYDVEPCFQCYKITVSTTGYTSDKTVSSTEYGISIPKKYHITVNSKTVSSANFQIDKPAQINLTTVNTACEPVGNVSFSVAGGGIVATTPDRYNYENTISTNSSGEISLTDLHWGEYNFSNVSGHNFVGIIPARPINILAGSSQVVNIVIANSTTKSLLATVRNSNTLLPIPNARVTLTSGIQNFEDYTGVGYFGQENWTNKETIIYDGGGFWSVDNIDKLDNGDNTYALRLAEEAPYVYKSSGVLESATFDFGSATVDYLKLDWRADQPTSTTIKFQIATSDTATPEIWNFVGPDGTDTTYFDASDKDIPIAHDGERYLRYKLYLNSSDANYSPIIYGVYILYVKSCSLPGQVYFSSIPNENSNSLRITADGYIAQDVNLGVINSNTSTIIDLISNN
ncbi:MAG: prepilin-type N-terminal cleavage/methylation domain-containing protein [Candidatus Magasanikbacteria bacterium]